MRTVISIASAFVCALSLDAQIVGRVDRRPDGTEQIWIRNSSTKQLAAFVLSVKHISPARLDTNSLNGPLVVFSDPLLLDTTVIPLPSGEERTITMLGIQQLPRGSFMNGTHFIEQSILTAGIFEDGTSIGDPILLGRLIVRRSNMLQAVETAVALLSNAGGHNISRRQLVEEFQTLADFLNHWYLPPEQQVGRNLYQSIVGKLLNLPEPQFGSPFPPTDFVAQVTASLNRQRVRLLASEPSLQEAAVFIGR
jgi:hypothetical protein